MLVLEELIKLKETGHQFISIDEVNLDFEEFGINTEKKDD